MPTPPHFTSNGNPGGNVNNHADGYNYDAAGDVMTDSLNQYAYDGEGRLCAAYSGGGVYTEYIYDADGQRMRKQNEAPASARQSQQVHQQRASKLHLDSKKIVKRVVMAGEAA